MLDNYAVAIRFVTNVSFLNSIDKQIESFALVASKNVEKKKNKRHKFVDVLDERINSNVFFNLTRV